MRRLLKKICSGILVMGFVIMGLQGVLHAETVAAVQARLDAEKASYGMSMASYSQLLMKLKMAQMAYDKPNVSAYQNYTAAYNQIAGEMAPDVAARIQGSFDPLSIILQ